MHDRFEAYLTADDVTFDATDAALLRAIADHGSVSGAATELGRSRARALGRLEDLEAAFGSLVERHRGGAGGGGSRLTEAGRDLLVRFDRLRTALSGSADVDELVLQGTVTTMTGELGVVETSAGAVSVLVVDASRLASAAGCDFETTSTAASAPDYTGATVQVSVRADAVTLHAPEDAPPGGGTSARNRFSGTVTALDREEAVVRVTLDVGLSVPLFALVTAESVDRLGLEPGLEAVATFKATATRATVVDDLSDDETA